MRPPAKSSTLPVCVACLFRCGWGIKRVCRHTGFAKTTVHRFMRLHQLSDERTAAEKKAAEDARRTSRRLATDAERKRAVAERAAQRALDRMANPPMTQMQRYYANHEHSKRVSRERARAIWRTWHPGHPERIKKLLRARIYNAIIRQSADTARTDRKAMPTMQLVGCDVEMLRLHIESQFKPGMTWENMGQWHIDHIKPCASFDLSKPEDQMACFHYTNLQPLWARDNLRKHARFAA